MKDLEESTKLNLDWEKLTKAVAQSKGIIPVAVQDAQTKEVILIAYTNNQAFKKAMETKKAVFWSTSRNEIWEKGKTSGNEFTLIEAFVNCEQNSLVYVVRPTGAKICHTNNKESTPRNCYYRKINPKTLILENLDP